MILHKKIALLLSIITITSTSWAFHDSQPVTACSYSPLMSPKQLNRKRTRKPCLGPAAAKIFGEYFYDIFDLHLQMLHWDSFKVVITFFPFYIAARMIDEKLHHCFYMRSHHKNVNQLPGWTERFAELSLGVPIVFFGLNAFCARDNEFREACRVFLVGMPFVVFGKKLIKQIRFHAGLRPWNEHFNCHKRALGGFPSGHLAEATYMAVLFGMRFGPRCAIPLSLLALGIGITFLNCNRHYVSQMIAGAGFGTLYALAADKLITKKLNRNMILNPIIDGSGTIGISFNWRF